MQNRIGSVELQWLCQDYVDLRAMDATKRTESNVDKEDDESKVDDERQPCVVAANRSASLVTADNVCLLQHSYDENIDKQLTIQRRQRLGELPDRSSVTEFVDGQVSMIDGRDQFPLPQYMTNVRMCSIDIESGWESDSNEATGVRCRANRASD